MPWYVPLIAALVGATVGGGATFVANIIRLHLDLHAKRVDEINKEIASTANSATEYWLAPYVTPEVVNGRRIRRELNATRFLEKEEEGNAAKAALAENQMLSAQARISSIGSSISSEFSPVDQQTYSEAIADFFDALTGGSFKARDGSIDEVRAAQCQLSAASLSNAIQKGAISSYSVRRTFHRVTGGKLQGRRFRVSLFIIAFSTFFFFFIHSLDGVRPREIRSGDQNDPIYACCVRR